MIEGAASPLLTAVYPDWPAPSGIVAFTTSRLGGVSEAPYQSLNLASHVGDNPQRVSTNRQHLLQHCAGVDRIQWLNQLHGTEVIEAAGQKVMDGDACFTSQAGLACAVLTADCLPLLICDRAGQQLAAVHAGWRGLLAGIIEKTLARFTVEKRDLLVWLGPAISQPVFEVGAEVRQAFLQAAAPTQRDHTKAAFLPCPHKARHYLADLYQLAKIRLQANAVVRIYGGDCCSYQQSERFYSYRRDGVTGRMVSMIYRQS